MHILICDDHSLFAQAVASLLNRAGHEVTSACSPVEAEAVAASTKVDVCLMDLQFPNASGVDGVAGVRAVSPETQVVVLTGLVDHPRVAEAVAAGAAGVTIKGDDVRYLIETIARVHAGERVLDAVGSARRSAPRTLPDPSPARFLTRRERQVLERLVAGESTADLAQFLGVRYSTARTHIQNVLTKLGVHSKVEAVVFALNHGIVGVAGPEAPGGGDGTTGSSPSPAARVDVAGR